MINKSDEFQALSTDSVISLQEESLKIGFSHHSFLVCQFTKFLLNNWRPNVISQWCSSGVEAWVLEPGQQWRKGKVRLTIEFCPDEGEPTLEPDLEETEASDEISNTGTETVSPLDDIRQAMNPSA